MLDLGYFKICTAFTSSYVVVAFFFEWQQEKIYLPICPSVCSMCLQIRYLVEKGTGLTDLVNYS